MTSNGAHSVSVERDIVFATGATRDLLLNVYKPAVADKQTLILHLHGGGFRGGDRNGCRLAEPLAALGYVSVASQYTFGTEAKWPAQINDVKAAIRWARAHAGDLGADPAKIVIMGYSAGANLALTAAGTPNLPEFEGNAGNPGVSTDLAGCIAFYPPDTMRRGADGSEHLVMPAGADDAAYHNASPISHAKAGYPPTALFHATSDTTVPFESSVRLFNALQGAGVPSEMHIFQGLSHVFDRHEEFVQPCAALIDLFLDRNVVNPRVYPPFGAPVQAGAGAR